MRIAFKSFRLARLDASASSLSALGATLIALTGLAAFAEETDDAVRDPETPDVVEAVADDSGLAGFDAASALSADELTEHRAMSDIEIERITVNDTDQEGTVEGNTAVGDTGGNYISNHAFDGASGVVMSVQNTGNNVLIQNSTTINVSVEQ